MNFEKTYCNPLKIEQYPMGYEYPPHRSLADPSVLFHDGVWYMYPSYGMAYVSENFIDWKYHKIDPCDVGYAPTIVKHRGKFYLYGRDKNLYVSDTPLGPFENLGIIKRADGTALKAYVDPMIFSDNDERVYIYYTLSAKKENKPDISIWGTELDPENLTSAIGNEICLIRFDNTHTWECYGARNQNTSIGWIEGVWMFKRNGRYYLTYSACGTEYGTYAMGAYYSDKGPLSGFVYQKHNPICSKPWGIIAGGGHGCIVEGPNDTMWAFYTCIANYSLATERRVAMDPVAINEDGELMVLTNTDSPQWAPGVKKHPYYENDTGLLPLTYGERGCATSSEPGRDSLYAFDESMLTWWQPKAEDSKKILTVSLNGRYSISSARVIWRNIWVDPQKRIFPEPIRYKIEVSVDEKVWNTVIDKSKQESDYLIDYEAFETTEATHVRLVLCDSPKNFEVGVVSFTVFGEHCDS